MIPARPDARRHPHQDALAKAWEGLSSLDIDALSSEPGVHPCPGGRLLAVRMLGGKCCVSVPSRTVRYDSPDGEEVRPYLQVLLLHYLLGVSSCPLTDRWVSFRELDGGALYYPAFKARAIDPLVRAFGQNPGRLRRSASSLGAEPLSIGETSLVLRFFDKLPVALVLWAGDDEVAPSASMMFDASANKMLSTEDLTVVGGVTSRALVDAAKE